MTQNQAQPWVHQRISISRIICIYYKSFIMHRIQSTLYHPCINKHCFRYYKRGIKSLRKLFHRFLSHTKTESFQIIQPGQYGIGNDVNNIKTKKRWKSFLKLALSIYWMKYFQCTMEDNSSFSLLAKNYKNKVLKWVP